MFNIFRNTGEPTILCALPDGGRMPDFLRERAWRFDGKVADIRDEQLGFDVPTVNAVLHRNGFYIYARI